MAGATEKAITYPIRHRMNRYVMRDRGYHHVVAVPYITGCFMLFRTEMLRLAVDGYLLTIFPDGRAIQIQSGILRARYRNPDGEPELLTGGDMLGVLGHDHGASR